MKKIVIILFLGLINFSTNVYAVELTTYNCERIHTNIKKEGSLSTNITNRGEKVILVKKIKFSKDKWGATTEGTVKFINKNGEKEYILKTSVAGDFDAYLYRKINNEFINNEENASWKKTWRKNKGKILDIEYLWLTAQENNYYLLHQIFAKNIWSIETEMSQTDGEVRTFACVKN